MSDELITEAEMHDAPEWAWRLANDIVMKRQGCGNAAVLIHRAFTAQLAEARESERAAWQIKPEWRRGHGHNCDHPLLDAILQVRRRNAGDLTPGYRSGNEGEAYDQGVLDCYHAIERVMFGLPALDWTKPPRLPVADHGEPA